MIPGRLLQALRLLRAGGGRYAPAAYLVGACLPGRRDGAGPVAAPRGWPLPDIRPGAEGAVTLGHVGLYPGVRLHCRGAGRIAVGDGSFLNRRARIFACDAVRLGRNCMVSWETVITDRTGMARGAAVAPVEIGDEVWIGCRAVILGGTRLGRGCIVAAGAVVQGVYPDGTILTGQPAEVAA